MTRDEALLEAIADLSGAKHLTAGELRTIVANLYDEGYRDGINSERQRIRDYATHLGDNSDGDYMGIVAGVSRLLHSLVTDEVEYEEPGISRRRQLEAREKARRDTRLRSVWLNDG